MSQKLLSVKNTKCMPLPFQSHEVHGQIGVFAWPILAPDPYVWHPSSKVDTSLKLKMNSLIWVFLFVCFINHWKLSLLSGPAAHSSFTAQMGVPRPHFGNPCFLHYCSFLFFFFKCYHWAVFPKDVTFFYLIPSRNVCPKAVKTFVSNSLISIYRSSATWKQHLHMRHVCVPIKPSNKYTICSPPSSTHLSGAKHSPTKGCSHSGCTGSTGVLLFHRCYCLTVGVETWEQKASVGKPSLRSGPRCFSSSDCK